MTLKACLRWIALCVIVFTIGVASLDDVMEVEGKPQRGDMAELLVTPEFCAAPEQPASRDS